MKSNMTLTLATLGLALAGAVLATAAQAGEATQGDLPIASQGKTRAQVKAELAEATRTGDIASGLAGLKLNELYPSRYPAKPAAPGKTRDEVRAELADAIRAGDIDTGEGGARLRGPVSR